MRFLLGFVVGLIVRLLARSYRIRVMGESATGASARVFAFWHGRQLALLGIPRTRPTAALVSWSRDGQLQNGAQAALGLRRVRGSSSRGGATALRRLIRLLDTQSCDVALAVDGPRGPLRRAKRGAARAARRGNAKLHPVGSWAERVWRISSAWDDFEIPRPFSRVVVCVGPALDASAVEPEPRLLERAIEDAEARARLALLSGVREAQP
ncbi:MAG: DUF374 domain-containing protein [Polyangiaceae bacterium]